MDPDDFSFLDWGSGDIDFGGIDFGRLGTVFSEVSDIDALFNLGGTYDTLDAAIADYAEKSGQSLADAQQKFAQSGLKLEDLSGIKKAGDFKNFLKTMGFTNASGTVNPLALLGVTGLLSALGQGQKKAPVVGYTGGVPKYTAVRERVAIPEDPNRRPGAGGRRYFSDVTYAKDSELPTAREAAKTQAETLKPALYPAPQPKTNITTNTTTNTTTNPAPAPAPINPASGVINLLPVPKYDAQGNVIKAEGGLLNLARGRYLNGSSDGMEDKIPATIADKQPARLSHGEFVVPADVVSHLGNGNSNAGAQRLYDMMDRVRKARTGNPKQGKQINPDKYLPK